MIHRERKLEPHPKELTDANGIGKKELAKVIAWLKTGAKTDTRPDFKAYKSASVTIGLERLFQGKCAYCESTYTRTQPVDIEHWRPKAEVVDGAGRTVLGYPWLAMAWENLLPSCIDCNRARKQQVLRPATNGGLQWTEVLQGKANQFPLADEKKRATKYTADLGLEQPLLLDPCTDDPANFFRFEEDGVVVPRIEKPKTTAEKLIRQRALASIDVYALNRKGLVDERKERTLLLRARFQLITSLVNLEGTTRDRKMKEVLHSLIDSEIEQLVQLSDVRQPYSLLTQQLVTKYLLDLKRP
jgi:hypothetical protein